MRRFYSKPISPRVLRVLASAVFAVLLLPISGWFLLLLAPFVFHSVIGFRRTRRRVAVRACLMPAMMLLPLVLAAWINSHQRTMFCLVFLGGNRVAGAYLYPGVIEIGIYDHDPAGLKYLRASVPKTAADPLASSVQRFQRLEGRPQVYDCVFTNFGGRYFPVVDGRWVIGSIYSGLFGSGNWTHASFYTHFGPFGGGYPYSGKLAGFHFILPCLFAAIPCAMRVRRWRRHEYRLRVGLCVVCGYNLRGSVGDRCSECGATTEGGVVIDQDPT